MKMIELLLLLLVFTITLTGCSRPKYIENVPATVVNKAYTHAYDDMDLMLIGDIWFPMYNHYPEKYELVVDYNNYLHYIKVSKETYENTKIGDIVYITGYY